MKKVILSLIISLCCLGVHAEDIKIGDAKYKIYANGTAELKDYKKAFGDVVIPETVTNPKTGKEYPVTSIGQNAFKGSLLTSIVIPSSVSSVGIGAFKECNLLVSAELPSVTEIPMECFYGCTKLTDLKLGDITKVGPKAFEYVASGKLAPAYNILHSGGLRTVYAHYEQGQSEPKTLPLVITEDADVKNVDIMQIAGNEPVIYFQNKEAGEQVMIVAEKLVKGSVTSNSYGFGPWSEVETFFNRANEDEQSLREYVKYPEPHCYIFFGIEESADGVQMPPYRLYDAIEVAHENWNKEKFLVKLTKFVETGINDPVAFERCYSEITPEESVKYNSYMRKAVAILCDSIYVVKPELTPNEKLNLKGFVNNCLMFIGADYGIPNMTLKKWAEADILNRDVDNPQHKEDYERLLKLNERLLQVSGNNLDPYRQALQLASLCGLGRWKEASAYFPKVHRSVSDNGVYAVPYELTYMQNEIKKRGYKATTPTYAKANKVSNKADLIDFFVSEAIEAGVKHYEKKRAEKKAREMFYQSIGLDKKGRPVK